MTKKKKKSKEEEKPWCFYCDRTFDNEPTLVQHQKNKHYKCPECNRKLNTAQGLSVHAYQVHKLTITRFVGSADAVFVSLISVVTTNFSPLHSVPGAKPGRESMDREIFGTCGLPAGATRDNPFGDGGCHSVLSEAFSRCVIVYIPGRIAWSTKRV
jgi:DNA-directed RNA polymerase subunit RPC12/RpoP